MTESPDGFDKQAVIAKLMSQAAEVLKLKRETRPGRPFILEFSGSPKSGKTSAISALTIFLKRNGFGVRVLTERASVCPVSDKKDWLFNVWTSCSAITELVQYIANPPADVDVIICDRGIFDSLCWFTWLHEEGTLDDVSYQSLTGFLTLRRLRRAVDFVYDFSASPEVSIDREYAHLLTPREGSIMNESVLSSYRESSAKAVADFGNSFKKLESIDTSELNQEQVGSIVTQNVLAALQDTIEERVGYLPMRSVRAAVTKSPVFLWKDLDENVKDLTLEFAPRTTVEADPNRLQPIPIAILTDKQRRRVLVFRKSDRSLDGATSPESKKTLPYAGGHIRIEDSWEIGAENVLAVARASLDREIQEELGIHITPSADDVFCIWDTGYNQSSAHHMAMAFVCEVDLDNIKIKLDKYEFVPPGSRTKSGTVMEASALAREVTELEGWGQMILARIFNEHNGQQLNLLHDWPEVTDHS